MTAKHRSDPAQTEYVSIAEAALLYHVSRDYIRDRIVDGTLPAVRSGRRIIRISAADLAHMFRPVQSLQSILRA